MRVSARVDSRHCMRSGRPCRRYLYEVYPQHDMNQTTRRIEPSLNLCEKHRTCTALI